MVAAVRLAKYLARAGVASRRAAEQMIAAGRIDVDGRVERDPARDVSGGERILIDGRPVGDPGERATYAVNKPAGVISSARDTHGRATVVELVDSPAGRLYPVGRLDAETTGLILLTNDGELANLLTHPRHEVPKTYRATVAGGPVGAAALRALERGVALDDGVTAPARARLAATDVIELELREGRNRQVRRMCAAVGHAVVALERIRFGPLALGNLEPGEHRRLSEVEVDELRAAARR
jgi:23S rRNA pseudouridine2605 synthase